MMQLKLMQEQGLEAAVAALFESGVKGSWYDPSDFSTMFQDTAAATPVTDVGQSVGRINDKSGNGFHLLQATAASKPTLRMDANNKAYLEFDGVDDGMSCASFDMTATDEMSIFTSAAKISEAAIGTLVELSALIAGNNGSFLIGYPSAIAAENCLFGSKGTVAAFSTKTVLAVGSTARSIIALSNISAPLAELRVDDLSAVSTATTQGTGNFGNHTLYVGRRAGTSNPLHGNIYSLVIRNKLSSETEIASLKEYIKSKAGI